MKYIPLFVLWVPLLGSCVHGSLGTTSQVVEPKLLITGVEVEDGVQGKPISADSKIAPGQGFAIQLRVQGFLQVVEERSDGTASFLVNPDPTTAARTVRIPQSGFLRSTASPHSICIVASNQVLPAPSCAEDDGRGEDRSPPPPPPPKEDKAAPPPPARDDNSTRSKDLIRIVRRLLIGT